MTRRNQSVSDVVWNYLGLANADEVEDWFQRLHSLMAPDTTLTVLRNADGNGYLIAGKHVIQVSNIAVLDR